MPPEFNDKATARDKKSELAIRRYAGEDKQAVKALHYLALAEAGAHIGDGPWDNDLDHIESEYLESGGEFLVGEYGGRIVAMGGFQRLDCDTADVRRMRVDPKFQRRGFGEAILNQLQSRALASGFRKLVLDTSIRLEAAQKFYAKHGFHKTREEVSGDDKLIYFEKRLQPPV